MDFKTYFPNLEELKKNKNSGDYSIGLIEVNEHNI